MLSKPKSFFLLILLLVFSLNTSASTRLEVGDWDIDDDGRADALTDGLLFLRYAFELRGDALISGLISSNSEYTTATDIERELGLVYDASGDIDGDGNVDALTDGLLLLRYLFGLSGETLTVGVVANGATRTSSSDLEGFIGNLMPSAPYITLLGSAVLDHEQATDYVDAGATAMDYADGSVAVSVSGSVNSSVAGVYVLTYTAIDSEGNTAKPLTRTVTVADTTAPVIYAPSNLETLALSAAGNSKNENNIKAFLDSVYATDSVDEIIQVNNDAPEIFPIGLTNVIFNAVDSSGNIANAVSASVFVKTSQYNIEPDDTRLTYTGRWDLSNPKQPINYWQGTSIKFMTNGSSVSINLNATINEEYRVSINGILNESKLQVSPDQSNYLIATSLDGSSSNLIEIFKETNTGSVIFSGIDIQNGIIFKDDQSKKLKIAFYGDSNMEGYSLYSEKDRGGMGTYYAFPAMTSRMLDADMQIMAKSGATLAGEGLNNVTDFIKSVNWPIQNQDLIDTFNPDVIVVNAGANDIYSASENNQKTIIKQRYELMIEELRQFYGPSPHIVLMNAYGWDINEPANYSFEVVENLDNVSILLFPWCWEQWHGTMVEHAGQSRLLANHISQLNQNWSIMSDAEVFNPFGNQNLIANGNFEEAAADGFNSFGWRYFEDGVERVNDSDSAAEGNYYIRLNAGELVHQGQDATGDFIPGAVREGQIYEFSAMIRTNSASGTAEISMDFEGQNLYGRTNTQTRVFSVNNEWSEYSGEFIAPNDTWKIYFVLKSQIGQIDFDQVELRIPD